MAKLFALSKIIMPDDEVIEPNTVFDATATQAKQFDALNSARPATEKEIKDAEKRAAELAGLDFLESVAIGGTPGDATVAPEGSAIIEKPESGAPEDPQNKPKGRSA